MTRLSRRTATTRLSPKAAKQTAPRCYQHPIRWAFTSQALTRWRQGTHPIERACFSFIDLGRMKGWVGLVGWPVADGLYHIVVTRQLQAERKTGSVRRPKTGVLPTVLTGRYTKKPNRYRISSNTDTDTDTDVILPKNAEYRRENA